MKDKKPNAQLHFVDNGQALLYAADGNLTLWGVAQATPRATHIGQLVGVATTGASYITLEADNAFHAWEAATGQAIALSALARADYPLHTRAHLAERRDLGKAVLEVRDPLAEFAPQVLDIGARVGGYLQAWAQLPGQKVAVVLWGAGGWDDTVGKIFDWQTGQEAGRFGAEWTDPTLRLTADAQHLVSAGTLQARWLQLATGQSVMWVKVDEGNCAQLALHPQDPLRFAVAVWGLGAPDEVRIMARNAAGHAEVVQKWAAPGRVLALTFDATGQTLAGYLETGARVRWDCATGQVVGAIGTLPASAAAGAAMVMKQWPLARHRAWVRFDPTGSVLMHEAKNTVNVWNWAAGVLRYSVPGNFIGWAREGETFLLRREKEVCAAHATATGAEIPLDQIKVDSYALAQRLLVTGRNHPPAVYVWDALGEAAERLIYAQNRDAHLENWGLTPDGQQVVVLPIEAEEMAGVQVYAQGDGQPVFGCARTAASEQAHFGPGAWLAVCKRDWQFYQLPNEKVLGTFEHKGDALAFHPACTPQAAWGAATHNAYNNVCVRFFALGTAAPPVAFCAEIKLPSPVTYLTFHADGVHLACLLQEGTVEVWDVVRGERVQRLQVV